MIGKKVGNDLYIHASALRYLDDSRYALLDKVKKVHLYKGHCNVIKINLKNNRVSFLSYKSFEDSPHPELKRSWTVTLDDYKIVMREYKKNPPILHRKELLVHSSHPDYKRFKEMTELEESLGLLNRRDIGFKRQWLKVLKEKMTSVFKEGDYITGRDRSYPRSLYCIVRFSNYNVELNFINFRNIGPRKDRKFWSIQELIGYRHPTKEELNRYLNRAQICEDLRL